MADLSLARKLELLVGACCAIAALVLAVGAQGLASVNHRAQQIAQNNLKSAAQLAAINSDALRVQADVGNVALSSGPVAVAMFKKRIAATDSDMDRLMADYRTKVASEKQVEALRRFEIWWHAYRNYREHRLMVLASGDQAVFQTAYLGQGQIVADRAMTALSDLLAAEEASGKAAAAQAKSTYRSAMTFMIFTMVFGLAAALLLARYLTRLILKPVRMVAAALKAVAEGDLTVEVNVDQRDEVGRMAGALTKATRSMRDAVETLAEDSTTLATASEELTAISRQIGASATDVSHRAGQVASTAAEVSEYVSEAATGTEEMTATINEIARSTTQNTMVAESAVRIAEQTNRTMAQLGASSNKIGEVVQLINSIAEQTNLLALNATIEAARSGEYGKGFAVVAQEVKELAQATSRATGDITLTVDSIQADTTAAVGAIGKLGEVIDQISTYQNTVASAVEEQAATTADMGRAVSEAASGSGQIAETIAGVAESAALTNEGVATIGNAVTELAGMASEMRVLVSRFRH
jgi:methyl-accepting chemotaxis protein